MIRSSALFGGQRARVIRGLSARAATTAINRKAATIRPIATARTLASIEIHAINDPTFQKDPSPSTLTLRAPSRKWSTSPSAGLWLAAKEDRIAARLGLPGTRPTGP